MHEPRYVKLWLCLTRVFDTVTTFIGQKKMEMHDSSPLNTLYQLSEREKANVLVHMSAWIMKINKLLKDMCLPAYWHVRPLPGLKLSRALAGINSVKIIFCMVGFPKISIRPFSDFFKQKCKRDPPKNLQHLGFWCCMQMFSVFSDCRWKSCQQPAGQQQLQVETLTRPKESGQKGRAPDGAGRASERRTACHWAWSDKDGGVGWGLGGNGGRVRITCNGGDLSQTEIQYPVNSRHTPPCQTYSQKPRRIPLRCHHSSGLLIQTTTCRAVVTRSSHRGTCWSHEIYKNITPLPPFFSCMEKYYGSNNSQCLKFSYGFFSYQCISCFCCNKEVKHVIW